MVTPTDMKKISVGLGLDNVKKEEEQTKQQIQELRHRLVELGKKRAEYEAEMQDLRTANTLDVDDSVLLPFVLRLVRYDIPQAKQHIRRLSCFAQYTGKDGIYPLIDGWAFTVKDNRVVAFAYQPTTETDA